MGINSQKFASYWRNSLADAMFFLGGLSEDNVNKLIKCDGGVLIDGKLKQELTQKFFKDKKDTEETIEIVFKPFVFHKIYEHGRSRAESDPEFVLPIATVALLDRDGRLYPLKNKTLICRDILEPLMKGAFSIGSMDNLDLYLTKNTITAIHYESLDDEEDQVKLLEKKQKREQRHLDLWNSYVNDCRSLLQSVAQEWLNERNKYQYLECCYLIDKSSVTGSVFHILSLYDKLREQEKTPPLFETFSAIEQIEKQNCEDTKNKNILFSQRLAHSSDKYPLANAQRDALSHLLKTNNGEILAVNGPPGTGKTTLLLSVVASLWAKHALDENEPPVIVAASTNNQAVTNIIDSFGKDFSSGNCVFSGRWLPDIRSFGAYYPSSLKRKIPEIQQKYHTDDFFGNIEKKDYFIRAKQYFIKNALKAFPNLDSSTATIKNFVKEIHNKIKEESEKLNKLEILGKKVLNGYTLLKDKYKLNKEFFALMEEQEILISMLSDVNLDNKEQLNELNQTKLNWQTLENKWQQYESNESIIYSLFSWLPPIAEKRNIKARLYINNFLPTDEHLDKNIRFNDISTVIENKLNQLSYLIKNIEQDILKVEYEFSNIKNLLNDLNQLLQSIDPNVKVSSFNDIDNFADIKIRFNIFLLTTHYWEGRWLIEMEDLLPNLNDWKKQRNKEKVQKLWRLRMMLTPCIVSTFYILPGKFTCGYNTKDMPPEDYLYDFADLLIVDEAGQTLPEVAGASFSLAKKALVVGDTEQIPPIWSIIEKIDIGNLLALDILPNNDIENEYEKLKHLGKTSSSGSVMKIAQETSKYHYDLDMKAGMFLYEHRRCYNEIISFCNELVYKGKLEPKRGELPPNAILPAIGYMHINGVCKISKGSRFNREEVKSIVSWLVKNKSILETEYKKSINEIVGIVTPFSAQVKIIKEAILNSKINNQITVGTVHSLQGSERNIIIFSAVYSKHSDGNFIDQELSLLNVAVSRAKDCFLVFGDMDLFNPVLSSARGILARYLFKDEANLLIPESIIRKDLESDENNTTVQLLQNADEHDNFLKEILNQVENRIIIVSPWLNMQIINELDIIEQLKMLIEKKVHVSIYVDLNFNIDDSPSNQQQVNNKFFSSLFELKKIGINIQVLQNIHSKLIMKDNNLLCVGSFNWFSAHRKGDYARHETSIVYQGDSNKLIDEIELLNKNLQQRIIDVENF